MPFANFLIAIGGSLLGNHPRYVGPCTYLNLAIARLFIFSQFFDLGINMYVLIGMNEKDILWQKKQHSHK